MSYSNQLDKVSKLLVAEKALEAQKVFQQIQPEESINYYLIKGKLEQKFQKWGEAINAYSKVLEFEPDNQEAKNNLHIIKNILNFWNPEMFNP